MRAGKEFGPYIVDKELGSGAMGAVYLATHKTTPERVAIKLMSPALGTSDQARARFVREFAILKQLSHPNIVRYKGSGRYHGAPFFIMEFVDGESLDHVMARRDRLTWEEIVDYGTQLCQALEHAHEKGIIHRDLKPSNIMVLRDGTLKLTDFGIAKDTDVTALTAANSTVGTAAYMSPEQCRGDRNITAKSDLYSLGVVLYELLTGRKPFTADTAMEMFMKHAKAPFAPPSQWVMDCPTWLNTLICQLMEKKPENRPLNATTVAAELLDVKTKMTAQQSAGVLAASKRRVDRTATDVPLDETDKEAARMMLGKKKKKKKAVPFYRKGWFTIVGLAGVAVALFVVIYFTFIRAPSADSLYAEAQALVNAGNDESTKAARAADGPITLFLSYYPDDRRAAQVQAWADQIDCDRRERQMLRRRGNTVAEKGAEEKARLALDNEDLGKLELAASLWTELSHLKTDTDADQRPWGLVAERYLKDLQGVDALHDKLRTALDEKQEGSDASEKLALQALREEAAGQRKDATQTWEQVKRLTSSDPQQRRLYLLAARMKRELDTKEKS